MAENNGQSGPTEDETGKYDATAIRVLGGIEHVRLRPAMYIGDTSVRGLHHLFEEVVANAIDEAMIGECDEIHVRLYADGSLSVSDNGRGIPVDPHPETGTPALEVVMTTLHAGGKFDHNVYKVSAGLHGVGVSCVNALSEWLEAEVWLRGELHYQRYERGEPTMPVEVRGKTKRRGTRIQFKPDPDIFEAAEFQYDTVAGRLRELAFLNSGTKIILSSEVDGREGTFFYENGIAEFVQYLNEGKKTIHDDVINIQAANDGTEIALALQFNDGYNETVFCFANNINTVDGGTHLSGFRSALTRTLNNYGREKNQYKDFTPQGEDYREGLTAVVSVKLPNPQFEGQTKTRLGNRDVQGLVEQMAGEQLAAYCEEHPTSARAIVEKAVEAARARVAAKKARDITRRKGALSSGNLPGKLRDCSSSDRESTELFIVEGQSAGGTAGMGRDREFQAILPLRGVILNVEKARVDKVLSNVEITVLISALGAGIGTDGFDLGKLRYGKVIIMTDADVDGAHIRTLLLTFFFRQMPDLIEKGHLYIAQPPLYRVMRRGKKQYVQNDRELQRVLVDLGTSDARLEYRLNGAEHNAVLEGAEFRELLDIVMVLERLMRLVGQRGISFAWYLAQRIGGQGGQFPLYRVLHMDGETGEHELFFYGEEEYDRFVLGLQDELAGREEQLEIIDEDDYEGLARARGAANTLRPRKFHEAPELERIVGLLEAQAIPTDCLLPSARGEDEAGRFIIQAGKEEVSVRSLAEIIPAVRELGRKGLDIERYKGLGEMNATELAETTLLPASRSLLQVTVGDAVKADNYFSILAGKDVKRRREFIELHALEVQNLDV